MFNRFLETLPPRSYIAFPPAQDPAINFAQTLFKQNGLAQLPQDYIAFLKITDGFSFNGSVLYGIRSKDRQAFQRAYFFPGLLEANLEFANKSDSVGQLMIGQTIEAYILYNESEGTFLLQDIFSKEILNSVRGFSNLLSGLFK